LCFFFRKMSYTDSQGRLYKRSIAEAEAAMAKIDKGTIVMERAVVRQDVMVALFAFINETFQENGWQSLFTSNKFYLRLVGEFYKNMKIAFFSPDGPVLETTVREQFIQIHPDLISRMTNIPLAPFSGIPFPNSTPAGTLISDKKTVMKSDAQLQRHWDPEEPAHPPALIQPEPLAASSSQAAPPSDAILSAIDRISQHIESMDTY